MLYLGSPNIFTFIDLYLASFNLTNSFAGTQQTLLWSLNQITAPGFTPLIPIFLDNFSNCVSLENGNVLP